MLQHPLIRFATVATSTLVLSLSLSQVQAAPVCKELDAKSQCTLNTHCSWVNSYTTKKGNKISAYCRKKGGSKKKSGSNKKAKASQASNSQKKSKPSQPKSKQDTVKVDKIKKDKTKKGKDKKSKNKKSKSQ